MMKFEALAHASVPIQDIKQVVEHLPMQGTLPTLQHEDKACKPTLQKRNFCIVELAAKVEHHRRRRHRCQMLARDLTIRISPGRVPRPVSCLKQLSILRDTCNVTDSCCPVHSSNHFEADAICLHIAHV